MILLQSSLSVDAKPSVPTLHHKAHLLRVRIVHLLSLLMFCGEYRKLGVIGESCDHSGDERWVENLKIRINDAHER